MELRIEKADLHHRGTEDTEQAQRVEYPSSLCASSVLSPVSVVESNWHTLISKLNHYRLQMKFNGLSSDLSFKTIKPLVMKRADIKAYVGFGSNLNDRAGNLLLAVRGMMNAGLCVSRLSSVYETEPVDVTDQPPFLNMTAELSGDELPPPEQLLARLLRIEYTLGRRRDRKRGPRIIDLDLLLYGDEERATEFLALPHPRLHLRRFVLMPLAELAPHLLHPALKQPIARLLAEVEDTSKVERWQANDCAKIPAREGE